MTTSKTNVPSLRFPSFTDPWKATTLGGAIKSIDAGWSPQCAAEPASAGVWGILKTTSVSWDGYNDQANKRLLDGCAPRKAIEVKAGDILVTRAGPSERVGVVAHVDRTRPMLMLSDKIIRLRCNDESDSNFIARCLESSGAQEHLLGKKSGLAKSQTNISQKDLMGANLRIPTLPEQRKIADFLTAVDGRIGQLSQKKALLEDYKKGVMQQLFTKALRFKDDHGNDFPEWEEKTVEEMFTVTRGKVLAMPETKGLPTGEFRYPVYSSQTKSNGLAGYYDKFLFRDAITWTTDGANAGDVKFRQGEFYCTNVCGVLLSDKGYANAFLASILGTVTRQHVSYVGNPKLMNNVMSKISIFVPTSIEEQTKIANFLTALDRKIESVSSQITHTQTFKKGLLQQMFV